MNNHPLKRSLKLFALPLGLVLLLELSFRLGVWEPLMKVNSHAYFSKQSKQYNQVFTEGRVNIITVGDSRARIGINHGTITKLQKKLGVNHLNMTMNRSHLTTFKAVTDWSQRSFERFGTVIIAMSKTGLQKVHYGPFELAKIQPFQPWNHWRKTKTYDEVGYKNGSIQKIANLSAIVPYRKDIRDFIANPFQRFREWQHNSKFQNVYENIGAEENICAVELSNIVACQQQTNHSSLNQGRQNALKRYCNGELALTIQQHGQQKLPTIEVHRAITHWTDYLTTLAQNDIQVIMLWLPDHKLLKKDLSYSNEHLISDAINDLIENTNEISVLDLTDLFDNQEKNACHFFYEPIHPNKYGTKLITRKLRDFIIHRSSQ